MIRGYARVSTDEQNADGQVRELEDAGAECIYIEHASGALRSRQELDRLLRELKAGDELVVVKLDRLGRSLSHLLALLEDLDAKEVGFRSLRDSIDLSTAPGRLMMQIVGAFAEFERELIRERTKAGMAAAKARGKHAGRPRALTPQQVKECRTRLAAGDWTIREAAELFSVHRTTIERALARES